MTDGAGGDRGSKLVCINHTPRHLAQFSAASDDGGANELETPAETYARARRPSISVPDLLRSVLFRNALSRRYGRR